jgi:hypothetical protein
MSTAALSERFVKSALCEMIEASRTPQGFEVTLPQAYASGNAVAVVIAETRDGYVIHDNSYAAMLLERSGTSRAASLSADVAAAVEHYGCQIREMRVTRTCTLLDEVPLSAVLVGCASRLVADQALKVEKLPMFDFKAKLLGTVREIVGERRIRTNEQVTGHLGSNYKVSTVVLDEKQNAPVAFLEPISEQAAVARKFKEFYDISLNSAYADVERVTVIDETRDIPAGDALLMQEVSTLLRFRDAPALFRRWATNS